MQAGWAVADNAASTIRLELNEGRTPAAFGVGYYLRIWEKGKIIVGSVISTNKNVKDIECDFAEEIRDDLIDKWRFVIVGGKGSASFRESDLVNGDLHYFRIFLIVAEFDKSYFSWSKSLEILQSPTSSESPTCSQNEHFTAYSPIGCL